MKIRDIVCILLIMLSFTVAVRDLTRTNSRTASQSRTRQVKRPLRRELRL